MRICILLLFASIATTTLAAEEGFKFGPSASIGLIQPYLVQVDAVMNNDYEFGAGFGQYTYSIDKKTKADITMQSVQLQSRWFPWAGSFFTGLLAGRRTISGDFERDLKYKKANQELDFTAKGNVTLTSYYLTPHFGWRWLWDSGFVLGMDFGYHLTVTQKSSSDVSANDKLIEVAAKSTSAYKEYKKDIDKATDRAASLHMPYITLLRIGYFF
jgi:hypothetical protein